MVDLITFVALVVITYLLYDHLLRMVKVGRYGEKYVIVTGCDSGFGQRLAIRLDALGFNVFAGCLTEDGRIHLSQKCSKRLVPFPLDVTDTDSIQSAFDFVKRSLPKDTEEKCMALKVIIVEPGAFKTPSYDVEKFTLGVQKSFDNATEEVQSVFKDCVSIFHKRMSLHPASTNLDTVVDAYIHGLTSRFPRTRYTAGLDSLLMIILFLYPPTIITDWCLQYQHKK